jgi:hypothetical protein
MLDREIAETPDRFTPWLKMEWQRLRNEFAGRLPGAGEPPSRRQREA